MRYLYTFLFLLFLPLALLRLYWRGAKAPKYRERWGERLGFPPFRSRDCIWVHVVSLGETIAAVPLIKKLIEAHPDREILVTSTTPTGSEKVKAQFGSQVKHCYMPYDLPFMWSAFFWRVKPSILILLETELWPNLLHICRARKIPTVLANGRLSDRSCDKYKRFSSIAKHMMQDITFVIAQTENDKKNYVALGLNPDKCAVTGNLKFDLSPPADIVERALTLKNLFPNRLVWIAASTHQGEEVVIMRVQKKIRAKMPEVLLILVPRHPERFPAVEEMALEHDLKFVTKTSGAPVTDEIDIFLGNTMGELLTYYAASSVAFVGGSLIPVGGHNLLEPAALGLPCITGPHMENFVMITKLLVDADGAIQIEQAEELEEILLKLLHDPERRAQMGKNGQDLVAKNRGSVDRQHQVIEKFIPKLS
ncbi:MAG: 3-deoxy-D-manno-octulosonic acid transferase [Gammaproteobacteria bacterium]|nr:3-deoxy-D-manno-octulosonic acid transferase [Gammaproteobacteria bacterium]